MPLNPSLHQYLARDISQNLFSPFWPRAHYRSVPIERHGLGCSPAIFLTQHRLGFNLKSISTFFLALHGPCLFSIPSRWEHYRLTTLLFIPFYVWLFSFLCTSLPRHYISSEGLLSVVCFWNGKPCGLRLRRRGMEVSSSSSAFVILHSVTI